MGCSSAKASEPKKQPVKLPLVPHAQHVQQGIPLAQPSPTEEPHTHGLSGTQPGCVQIAQPCPPVPLNYAKGFLSALRSEYLMGVSEGVGRYYGTQGVPDDVQNKLDPFEDRVRNAGNKDAAITALTQQWGMDGSVAPAEASQPTAQTGAGSDLQPSVTIICNALNIPLGTPPQTVAMRGLQSQDLEVLRHALYVSPQCGVVGHPEVQQAEARLRGARGLPADWDILTYSGGRFLEGGSGGRQASTVVAYHKQPASVVEEIQSLFDATYRKVYTRDRRGAPIPDRFIIREVQRVMNDQVWREYTKCRNEVRQRLRGSRPVVPDGAGTMNHLARRHSMNPARPPLLPTLDPEVNEVWLFHGTTKEAAQGIAENDFRLDLTGSNAGTLYGKGIYLAENVTKSDEYGEGPKGPAGEEEMEQGYEAPRPPPGPPPPLVRESYILLCRSTLGKIRYTDDLRPNADDLQKKCLNGEFDSVLGDRLKRNGTFRELVVYNDDRLYPEYIIHYERIFFHERFAEIYSAMSKRQKQGTFKGPTPQEKEVLQSLWNVYGMPNKGKINKWQLLDLLRAINQTPENEGDDLDATFREWDTKNDGWIDYDEFLQEMITRVRDGMEYYG